MKKLNLQLQNSEGEVLEEKQIQIGDDDTLVMHYPSDMSLEEAYQYFELVKESIKAGGEFIGVVNTISFSVIKKEWD